MTTEPSPYEIEMAGIAAYYAERDAAQAAAALVEPEPMPVMETAPAEPPKPAVLNAYYIRCREAEKPQLYALAAALGVLAEVEGVYQVAAPHAGAWDEIGPISRGDEVVVDADGNPYWHANLIINADLADIATALAPTSPEIAAGLADLARWFVVGADGKATAPKQPARVWL